MTEVKGKPILIDLDSIRIVKTDEHNVTVERLEKGTHPISKEATENWKVKGHYATIQAALRAIVKNEWLIDYNAVKDLETYCSKVADSVRYILEVIDEI